MIQLLHKTDQVHKEILEVLSWSDRLEVVLWRLEPAFKDGLWHHRERLKTLIVAVESAGLCDLCSGARVSRLERDHWPGNLVVGRKGSVVRAVMGSWDGEAIQQAFSLQGESLDADIRDLERKLASHCNQSRLAAGSPPVGEFRTATAPVEMVGVEEVRKLQSEESYRTSLSWLLRDLRRACTAHKVSRPSGCEVLVASGATVSCAVVTDGSGPWLVSLSSLAPQNNAWVPTCSMKLGPQDDCELTLGIESDRTFLLFRGRGGRPNFGKLRGMQTTTLVTSASTQSVQVVVVAELGRADLVRRLAEFVVQWELVCPGPMKQVNIEVKHQGIGAVDVLATSNFSHGLSQAMQELVTKGKLAGQLSHDEISEALSTVEVSPDQFDEILQRFAQEGIEVADDDKYQVVGREDEAARLHVIDQCAEPLHSPLSSKIVHASATDDLQQLIQNLEEGGTIRLGQSVILLKNPLTVTKALNLRGLSAEKSSIRCSGGDFVLCFRGQGPWGLTNLSFTNKVIVEGGEVLFLRCHFQGGLVLADATSGRVALCTMSNATNGVELRDKANVLLEENVCRNCDTGILFVGNASGVAKANECEENKECGIALCGESSPQLEFNRCLRGACGIAYEERASGVAKANECEENWAGIFVGGESFPHLESNRCLRNEAYGIQYVENASGIAKANQCEENTFSGIQLAGESSPHLEANRCLRNGTQGDCSSSLSGTGSGIDYRGNASGVARANECEENKDCGIALRHESSPQLEANRCLRNGGNGIYSSAKASGVAKANECEDNKQCGICLLHYGESFLQLESNRCRRNGTHGIEYRGRASGVAKANECEENTSCGIMLYGESFLQLESNHCLRNGHSGIAYSGNASGVARANECEDNKKCGIVLLGEAFPRLESNRCLRSGEHGIRYNAKASGVARANECEENTSCGIAIFGESFPQLESNRCLHNGRNGINYNDSASGVAKANECEENTSSGISLGGESSPQLESNRCLHNGRNGIEYEGRTSGIAKANECQENTGSGIVLWDESSPHLESNHCLRNGEHGIRYNEKSSGIATANECEENSSGISISDESSPLIESNRCLRNGEHGIYYSVKASGVAKANECEDNKKCGIVLGGESSPQLESNHCLRNGHQGICYWENASGVARANRCEENTYCGIALFGETSPQLESNRCLRNGHQGIRYREKASGVAKANECEENKECGIALFGRSFPLLESNRCLRNRGYGICYREKASGVAKANECEDNNKSGISICSESPPQLESNRCLRNGEGYILRYEENASGFALDPSNGVGLNCPDCGASNLPDTAYCECGVLLDVSKPAMAQTLVAPWNEPTCNVENIEKSSAPPNGVGLNCPDCGASNRPGTAYCECGVLLDFNKPD